MPAVPLNQVYKTGLTFKDYPQVEETYHEITNLAFEKDFTRTINQVVYAKGRRYDYAVLFENADFDNKLVCELGGRDSIFGAYLTKYASKVHISDYFEEWGKGTEHDLGDYNYWNNIWNKCAINPDRLITEHQDITNLSYPDNYFDIVICTSVIEHLFNQKKWMGDMAGIREIARITKPGGKILLSTDMAEKTAWISGTLYYDQTDLFDRIINPSKCKLIGDYDFNVYDENNTDIHKVEDLDYATSVVFSLEK